MELINFIMKGDKLRSQPVLTEFVEKYPLQNGGILGEDILKFVQLFVDDVSLCMDGNYRIRNKNVLMYVMNGSHMFYLYNNEDEHTIEKWDPSTWQKTTNNCTLYCGILASVRSYLTFEQTAQLIGRIIDKPETESCDRLGVISKHFFARNKSVWFRYKIDVRGIVHPCVVKRIEKSHVGQCLIMIRDMTQDEIEFLALDFKNKKRELVEAISSRDSSIYVATDDSNVFGFMNMFKLKYDTSNDGYYNYIDILFVAPQFRGNGYATKFIQYTISRGFNVRLRVKPNNSNMKHLVEKLGFKLIDSNEHTLLYEYVKN